MTARLTVLFLFLASFASAQQPVAGTERLAWNHDGINVSRFELAVDGGAPVPVTVTMAGADYTAPLPAMTPGTHTLSVRACNVAGCSAPLSISVRVVVIPSPVTNLRVTPE